MIEALSKIMFGKLKDWRRIHTRYKRCAHTFMSATCIAAIPSLDARQDLVTQGMNSRKLAPLTRPIIDAGAQASAGRND